MKTVLHGALVTPMNFDLPDPDDIDEAHLGPAYDRAIENTIELEDAAQAFSEFYVREDGIAELHELSDDLHDDIRAHQAETERLKNELDELRAAWAGNRDAIRQRMEDEGLIDGDDDE